MLSSIGQILVRDIYGKIGKYGFNNHGLGNFKQITQIWKTNTEY